MISSMEESKDDGPGYIEKRCREVSLSDAGLGLRLEDGTTASLAWKKIPGAWQDDDLSLVIDLEELVYVLPKGRPGYEELSKELPRRLGKRYQDISKVHAEQQLLVSLIAGLWIPFSLLTGREDWDTIVQRYPLAAFGMVGLGAGIVGVVLSTFWSPALLYREAYWVGLFFGFLMFLYGLPGWARAVIAAAIVGGALYQAEDAFKRRPSDAREIVLTLRAKDIGLDGPVSWPPFRFAFAETPTRFVGGLNLFASLKPGDHVKARAYYDLGWGFLISARRQ